MAQWYNGVFYADEDEPKKDDNFIPHSIPRIQEYDIANIEEIALKSKFDFAFIDKFSFKGLPENLEEQKKFLESNALAREVNPAGLEQKTNLLQQQQNLVKATASLALSGAISYVTTATNFLSNYLPNRKVQLSTGGRKTKKTRSQKNQKRTQRRLLAVDDR
jgi:hypothetical protein